MSRSSCEPCCNPTELSRGKEMYQSATLQILCAVLDALEGGGGVGENVVVTAVTPGTGATNLGKAEDSPHTTGDVGVQVLARRADTASSSTATDGDYATLNTDADGKLWVNAVISSAAITSVIPGTGATNLGKAEDAPHTTGDVGVQVLARRSDTASSSSTTDGDYSTLNTTASGKLWTDAEISVALPAGAATIGSIANITTAIVPGTGATNLGKAEDSASASGDVGVSVLAVRQDTLAASTTTDGDYSPLKTDSQGSLYSNPGVKTTLVTIRANYTSAQTDTAIVTVSAGTRIVVTRCSVLADHANTVDVQARIGFGTANTPTTTGVVFSHPGIAPGSGVVEGSGAGILGAGASNEDLRITSEAPTTGSIDVMVTYYTEPV